MSKLVDLQHEAEDRIRQADEARRQAEDARRAAEDEARRAADDARRATEEARRKAAEIAAKARADAEAVAKTLQEQTLEAERKARRILDQAAEDTRRIISGVTPNLDGSPDLSLGSVNGNKFYTPVDMMVQVIVAERTGSNRIVITTHEPEVIEAFRWLEGRTEEEVRRKLLDQTLDKLNIHIDLKTLPVNNFMGADDAADVAIIAAIFGGIATIMAASVPVILAVGVSIFIILLGFAILYAVHEHYNIKNVHVGFADGKPDITVTMERSA